jgi:SAM-dependent methyltransferase
VARLESDYYAHMGFDTEHSRNVLGHYVRFFEPGGRVLELAPGRGEFLGLLREAGIEAAGVDIDEGMVATARGAGHQVELGDAVKFMAESAAPASFDGVFAAHLVEHFPTAGVRQLLAGARRVLVPGGRLVLATPNPASWPVMSHDFWRDPTHVRFYDLPLLEFLCLDAGFEIVSSGINPCNTPGPRPGFAVPQPVVDPPMTDAIQEAALGALRSLRDEPSEAHDPSWALALAHTVKALAERLQATQEQLRVLWSAHQSLVQDLFQGNEIYVVGEIPRRAGGHGAADGTAAQTQAYGQA